MFERYFSIPATVAVLLFLIVSPDPSHAGHYPWDQGHDTCKVDVPPSPSDDCDKCESQGSPFFAATGAYTVSYQDFLIPGPAPLELTRTYHGRDLHNGMFGHGWTFTYGVKLIEVTDGVDDHVIVRRANSQRDRFERLGGGSFAAPVDVFDTLTENPDGTFEFADREMFRMNFDASGNATTWVDPNGNTLTFAYDSVGFLTSVTDDSGRSLQFTKGANGKVAAVSDPAGRVMSYGYDADGNLVSVTDPEGGIIEYSYDSKGNITAIRDPRGNVITSVTYDSLGRVRTYTDQGETYTLDHLPSQKKVIETDSQGNRRTLVYNNNINIVSRTDSTGKTETLTYDGSFNISAINDRNGNSTSFTFDSAGNRTSMTDPLGGVTTFAYEPVFNSLTAITDPLGNSTTFEHDSCGNMIKTTDAAGNVTQFSYDSRGLVSSTTDANGFTRTFAYDSAGYLTSETDSLGRVTTFVHDAVGNLTATTDPDGRTFAFDYDGLNRIVEIRDSLGDSASFEYAPRCLSCETPQLLNAVVDSDGGRTAFEYDELGRAIQITDPLGNIYLGTYDSRGNLVSATDALGRATQYAYDSLDRLIQVTRAGNTTTTYTYDGNNNVTRIKDPGGVATVYAYDALNRLQSIASPDTGTAQSTYDLAGRLVQRTDARGVVTDYEYDPLGRLIATHFPDPIDDVVLRYDETTAANGKGRLTSMSDRSGDTQLSYDPLGRLTSLTATRLGITYVTSYEYSPSGSTEKTTYPSGLEVDYAYDARGFVSSVSVVTSGTAQPVAANITYDALGNRLSTSLANGLTEVRKYDLNDRITEIDVPAIHHLEYSYDSVGNVLSIQDLVDPGKNQSFSYDDLDRVVAASGVWGNITYAYDASGNRIQRIHGSENLSYAYDANRLDSITGTTALDYVFDAAGNTISDGTFDYTYSQNGRLSQVSQNGGEVARYTFNGFGQRVIKEVDGAVTVFHYDNQKRLIEETAADGTSIRAYVYLLGDIPLALIEDGNVYFYHPDRLGTPRKVTDSSGTEVWSADLMPFGAELAASGSITQPLRFPGQYADPETGLYYNYHREYDPRIGRYLEPDPLGLEAGINLFVYTANNPFRYTDPDGLLTLREAVMRYFGIGGRGSVTVPFGDVDLGKQPRDFPGFMTQVQILYKKNGTKQVDITQSWDVGDLVFGHVTFRLKGTITSNKCEWSFKGEVSALKDTFDFNALPWGTRVWWKEIITRLFGTLPGGTPFDIFFSGKRSVSDGGKW